MVARASTLRRYQYAIPFAIAAVILYAIDSFIVVNNQIPSQTIYKSNSSDSIHNGYGNGDENTNENDPFTIETEISSAIDRGEEDKDDAVDIDIDVDVTESGLNENENDEEKEEFQEEDDEDGEGISTAKSKDMTDSNVDMGEFQDQNTSSVSSEVEGTKDDDDTRPWMIIHVGPPKTATTTIQAGLAKYAKMLARDDDFYFVGHKAAIREKDALIDVEGNGENVFRIYKLWPILGFGKKDVSKDLKKLLSLGRHAILSAEHFTTTFNSPQKMYENGFLYTPDGIISNHIFNSYTDEEELLFKFRVKVVVVYRHFFDWLPSLYFQSYTGRNPRFGGKEIEMRGMVDYTEEYLDKLVQYDPEDNSTNIFTTSSFGKRKHGGMKIATESETETSHGTVWSYLKWSSWPGLYESVDIFDLHRQPKPSYDINNDAKQDLFADFVCQALPFASNTCHHLRNETKVIHERSGLKANKIVSAIDKNRIVAGALKLPELHHKAFFEGNLHKRMEDWLHEAGVEANDPESSGFKKYKRCLNPEYTLRLKIASWNFLLQMVLLQREHTKSRKDKNKTYYASLFQSSTPTNHFLLSSQFSTEDDEDDSWVAPTKAAHDSAFDEQVSKLTFCEVNVEKLLESKSFVQSVFRIDKSRGKR
jgi:hypothetical protein